MEAEDMLFFSEGRWKLGQSPALMPRKPERSPVAHLATRQAGRDPRLTGRGSVIKGGKREWILYNNILSIKAREMEGGLEACVWRQGGQVRGFCSKIQVRSHGGLDQEVASGVRPQVEGFKKYSGGRTNRIWY